MENSGKQRNAAAQFDVFLSHCRVAILDGFPVDYEAAAIKSEVRMNSAYLKEGEEVGLIDTTAGKKTHDRRPAGTSDNSPPFQRWESIVKMPESPGGTKEDGSFTKSVLSSLTGLVPSSCQDPAINRRAILCRPRGLSARPCPNVDRPLQRIREFRNRPNPRVVVTVDVPSPTGVGEGGRRPGEGCGARHIPALEFIVFLRPVKSRILTMLGRGTRKCPEINKTKFTVFDYFDGTLIEYFKSTTDFEIQPPTKTPLTIPQVIENI